MIGASPGPKKVGLIYQHFVKKFPSPTEGSLRVWWIPQIPGEPFHWPVNNLAQASSLLDALAAYDDFQYAENVKGEYANAGGLEIYRENSWEDWYSEDGDDFDTYREARIAANIW